MLARFCDWSSVDIRIKNPVSGLKRQTPARTAFWNSLWTPSTLALKKANYFQFYFIRKLTIFYCHLLCSQILWHFNFKFVKCWLRNCSIRIFRPYTLNWNNFLVRTIPANIFNYHNFVFDQLKINRRKSKIATKTENDENRISLFHLVVNLLWFQHTTNHMSHDHLTVKILQLPCLQQMVLCSVSVFQSLPIELDWMDILPLFYP